MIPARSTPNLSRWLWFVAIGQMTSGVALLATDSLSGMVGMGALYLLANTVGLALAWRLTPGNPDGQAAVQPEVIEVVEGGVRVCLWNPAPIGASAMTVLALALTNFLVVLWWVAWVVSVRMLYIGSMPIGWELSRGAYGIAGLGLVCAVVGMIQLVAAFLMSERAAVSVDVEVVDGTVRGCGRRFHFRRKHERRLVHTIGGSQLELSSATERMTIRGKASELMWLDAHLTARHGEGTVVDVPEELRRVVRVGEVG